MKRLLPLLVSLFAVCVSPLLLGQQSDDATANRPPDNADVVSQIQELRADVERLSRQVDRLNDEIKSLQTTGSSSAVPARTRIVPAPPPAKAAPTVAASPAPAPTEDDESIPVTVLVFHDGSRVETKNYAIIGENIWVYSENASKKYRVADLDIEATKKVNSDHGVLFQLPPSR
ncbi:MAG: hypothetical protein ACRD2U_13080 [Terriglobales bacterium]